MKTKIAFIISLSFASAAFGQTYTTFFLSGDDPVHSFTPTFQSTASHTELTLISAGSSYDAYTWYQDGAGTPGHRWRTGLINSQIPSAYTIYSDNIGSVFTVSPTTGTVTFNQYGAGTLQTDSSGNITASSDARLKNLKGALTRGLSDILKLHPMLFSWKNEEEKGVHTVYPGFVAQDVRQAIPEAVGEGKDGMLSLQDRGIVAALVNAVKELDDRTQTMAHTVGAAEVRILEFIAIVALILSARANFKKTRSVV
jgi:hypothetical protein